MIECEVGDLPEVNTDGKSERWRNDDVGVRLTAK